jgi:ABC-2 type transport system ATP-binding protein
LKVRGEVSDLADVIQDVPGVLNVQVVDRDTLEFESSASVDARPEVVRRVVRQGIDLLDLHTASLSLEEIFLELTREDPAVPDTIVEPAEESAEEA